MPKVILVNPSDSTLGFSFITPRWIFVIAEATPVGLVGEPVLVDETIEKFDPQMIRPGDIVGIGISTGNCLAGYQVLKKAKAKGATVIMGGIHATIFPQEPLEMGADAVVTGNGDSVWSQAVRDAVEHRLQRQYAGGRVPGEAMRKARWGLLDASKYVFPSVQTVAGCPENCSFCSVWVTDGRQPRQRLGEKIIEEVNELYALGYRCLIFADDNFNPATRARIAREPSEPRRRVLEQVREERSAFFEEYDRRVPPDMFAFTQMTSEIVGDDEYLSAMYRKMRIRGALVGVESFSEEGLRSTGKQWNPAGRNMVETIQKIQESGIWVLSSIICGLESDTIQTIQTMRRFALESGSVLAQFTIYGPYPGTKDFYEMMTDRRNGEKAEYVPKHKTRIAHERYWLKPLSSVEIIEHASIGRKELLTEQRMCWEAYYSFREIFKRTFQGTVRSWHWAGKLAYLFGCLAFKRVYGGQGISADSVRSTKIRSITRMLVKASANLYRFIARRRMALQPSARRPCTR